MNVMNIQKNTLKKIGVLLFYVMFVYSGINKIFNFNSKVPVLVNKTGFPVSIASLGMVGVIILEIFGSLIMIIDAYSETTFHDSLVKFTKIMFILFLIVVTLLYHPPWKQIIPFLSNLTTFGGMIYMYSDL